MIFFLINILAALSPGKIMAAAEMNLFCKKVYTFWIYVDRFPISTYGKLFRPLQFNYLSYELFLEKKSCQTPKKKKKKVNFGVLRTKVVLKFSVRLQKKKKKKCKF